MYKIVPNEPKTGTIQIRINPEYKAQAEKMFSDCGLSLTEAINMFIQASMKVGGLPFNVNTDPHLVVNDDLVDLLDAEYDAGMASVGSGSDWITSDEMGSRLDSLHRSIR